MTEYMALEEGSPKRLALEHRYGKANIIRLVAKFEEDKSNAEWFKASTMACPGCHISVEKSAGCNHVGLPQLYVLPECSDELADDMREMHPTFLLSVWHQDRWDKPI